jgi:hypothetical protein
MPYRQDPPGLEYLTTDQLRPGYLIWSYKHNGPAPYGYPGPPVGWDVVPRVARKPGVSKSRPWRVWTKRGGEHHFAHGKRMSAYPGGKLPPTPDYGIDDRPDGPWW